MTARGSVNFSERERVILIDLLEGCAVEADPEDEATCLGLMRKLGFAYRGSPEAHEILRKRDEARAAREDRRVANAIKRGALR